MAFVERHDNGLCPVRSRDVGHYRQVLGRLAIEAWSPEASLKFLLSQISGGQW